MTKSVSVSKAKKVVKSKAVSGKAKAKPAPASRAKGFVTKKVVTVGTKNKAAASAKSKVATGVKAAAGRKRALSKATSGSIPVDAQEDRVRLVMRFARRHEVLDGDFIKAALKLHRSSMTKLERLDEYRKLVKNNLQNRIKDLADADTNRERFKKQADKKLALLDTVEKSFNDAEKHRFFLKPEHEALLGKIRLPKPLSGYMMFASAKRAEIKDNWEKANPSGTADFGTIGRQIGERWKQLTEQEHESWNDQAKIRNATEGIEKAKSQSKTVKSTKAKTGPKTKVVVVVPESKIEALSKPMEPTSVDETMAPMDITEKEAPIVIDSIAAAVPVVVV